MAHGAGLRRQAIYAAGRALHGIGALRALHRLVLPDTISILMYHGIVSSPLPVDDGCFVLAADFAEQMEYVARHFDVLHIEEALSETRARGKCRIACVTFDDGFSSVCELALPILERLKIPATAYLVTDLVDSRRTVWFAELHQAICETRATSVCLEGSRFPLRDPRERALASAALQRALKALDRPSFAPALEATLSQLGTDRDGMPWPAFRMLRRAEIERMTRDDLVRVGAHTASHQILTRTTPADARLEIARSVEAVAALVRRPSATFAYPNGGAGDFDATAIAAVRDTGLRFAVTTVEGPVRRGDDPYTLKRYFVRAGDPLARFAGLVHHTRDAVKALPHKLHLR
jgi:peptidoglycan/xylan/chitin deacetylase (PgdA/CDA1 family)